MTLTGSDRRTRWVRSPGVLWRRTVDGLLLLTEGSDEPLALQGTGALTWELLDRPTSLEGLADILEAVHDADRDRVIDDLRPFIGVLREAGAVVAAP